MKTITFFNQKGGVGKSTLTFNIAYLCSMSYSTAMWDMDTQKGLSILSGGEQGVKKGFYKILKKKKHITKKIFSTNWNNLFLIPSDDELQDAVIKLNDLKKSNKAVSSILKKINDNFDVVFIDPPPVKSLLVENIIKAVDYIFIPVIPNPFNYSAMCDTINYIQDFGAEKKIKGIIFNMVDMRKTNHKNIIEKIRQNYPNYFTDLYIPMSSKIEEMQIKEKPIELFAKSSKPAIVIRELFHFINSHI